tara:strand:- start:202 stop:858 length:657 start_codon:yes stop_codon:yes gene_type:complete
MATLKLGSTNAITESSGALTYAQAGGLKSMQVFETAGTFTGASGWQRPTGITTIKVYVTGAGGGAMSNAQANKLSGAAGGTAIEIIDVTSITSVDFTIGAGSTGTVYNNDIGRGGSSSFGSHCSATGGLGGYTWAGSDGGLGAGGDINLRGQGGMILGNLDDQGCSGGSSFWGGGARGSEDTGDSVLEEGIHGGGGGASDTASTNNGGTGIIVVEEYS